MSTANADLTTRLLAEYRAPDGLFDPSRWWLDAGLMADIVAGLADLHRDGEPTAVAGVESRGQMLGALVARQLGIAFVEVRKNEHPMGVGEPLLRQTTPPDYKPLIDKRSECAASYASHSSRTPDFLLSGSRPEPGPRPCRKRPYEQPGPASGSRTP